jgi:predicted MFS family arabinose efflux permease
VTANFVAPAVVSACTSLLAILLVRFVLPESHAAGSGTESQSRRGSLSLLRARPTLALLAAATLVVTYSQAVLESIFAIWALHRYGFGPRTVGFLLLGIAIPALLVQGGVVRMLAPRIGEPRLAICGVLVYVAGLVTLALAPVFAGSVCGLVLCGLGLGAYNPSGSALASRQSGPNDRGAVMGAYVSSASLARVIGPFTSGPIYAWLGSAAPFLVGACVTLPAAWLIRRASAARLRP